LLVVFFLSFLLDASTFFFVCLFTGGAWKKRWFVLVDDELQYFNSELALEASKNVVLCQTVTSMKEEGYKGRNTATKISFTVNGADNNWILDWDEGANAAINRMWMRKLYRSCSQLSDPTIESLKSKFSNLRASGGSHAAHSDKSHTPLKTKVPVSKRMSVFK
jgi:hypothetical protein